MIAVLVAELPQWFWCGASAFHIEAEEASDDGRA